MLCDFSRHGDAVELSISFNVCLQSLPSRGSLYLRDSRLMWEMA